MGKLSFWKLNYRILKAFNACNRDIFSKLLDDIMEVESPELLHKIFFSKLYLWNIIRPRDFYKMSSFYIIMKAKTYDLDELQKAERLMSIIITSTKNIQIKQSFVWNIVKSIRMLTIDTIQYTSAERIQNILESDKEICSDSYIAPFLEEIRSLKLQIKTLQELQDISDLSI